MDISRHDVVVLGGGPAGAVTAGLLARSGVRVALLERERFPRFHLGESIPPGALPTLFELGLEDALLARYLEKRGVNFLCSRTGRSARYAYDEAGGPLPDYGLQVPRADFDELLLRRAGGLGVELREGYTAEDVLFEQGRAAGVKARRPDGSREGFLAKVLVDATGRDTLLAARTGGKRVIDRAAHTALCTHYHGVRRREGEREGDLDVVLFPHGWWWNIPFDGDVNSVGAVCSASWVRARRAGEGMDAFFERCLDDAPAAKAMLSTAAPLAPVRAVPDLGYEVEHRVGDGWLAVGDASGFVDPLFCSGTLLAIRGAAEAARSIMDALAARDVSAARFAGYARGIDAARGRYHDAVEALYHGDLGDTLFENPTRAARQPLARLLAGEVFDPPP